MVANYDVDHIPEETLENLDDYIEENDLSDVDSIKRQSMAASNLASWVKAVSNYAHVRQTLQPIIDRKQEAEEILTQKIVEIQKIEQRQQELLRGKQETEYEDVNHTGLQTSFDGNKHTVRYEVQDEEGNIRLQQQEVEADVYTDNESGDGANGFNGNMDGQSLYFISNEIKKKDQSRKFVLWETNQMRNQWDEQVQSEKKAQAVSRTNNHHWTHEPKAEQKSVVDSIRSKGKPKKMPNIIDYGDDFASVPKKDHQIHNIFLQSNLQDRLQDQKSKGKAPWSHSTFNKQEKEKNYMVEGRPLFEGQGNHVQNINSGRNRIFYSSNVF